MNGPRDSDRHIDRVLLLFVLALFLLAPSTVARWATDDAHWIAPYFIWALLIGLGFWLQRRRDHDEL